MDYFAELCKKFADFPEAARSQILDECCAYVELSNHFWELEDDCPLKNGIDILFAMNEMTHPGEKRS